MRKILQRQNYPNRVVTISDVYGTIENMQTFKDIEPKRGMRNIVTGKQIGRAHV